MTILNSLLSFVLAAMVLGPGLLWALCVLDARRERRPR